MRLPATDLRVPGDRDAAPSPGGVGAWAASGAMALTRRPGEAPRVAPGDPADLARTSLAELGADIPGLLGERAAYAGLRAGAPWSCGGASRVLPCADGEVALTLSRESDIQLLPALTEGAVQAEAARAPWVAMGAWLRGHSAAAVEDRLRLLGMPGGAVRDPATVRAERPGVLASQGGRRRSRRSLDQRPLVVDLTALWAGPLCAHLLHGAGARVLSVEALGRPDGTRVGAPDFHALLHEGHQQVAIDFWTELDWLRRIIATADLVLESSRARALRGMGIVAEDVVRDGTSWLSVTARGRASDAVGFGDDVAACAGLVQRDDGGRAMFVGDAIADPLTGVVAAAAAAAALSSDDAQLLDVSMLHVAASVGGSEPEHEVFRRGDDWWVAGADGAHPVLAPRRR